MRTHYISDMNEKLETQELQFVDGFIVVETMVEL